MWSFLYQMSSPKKFYQWMRYWPTYLLILASFCFLIGTVWGLIFAPADLQQKDAFRLLYIHVPCAFLSMSIYGFMGFLSILLLVWRIKLAGWMLSICAEMGALMTGLALITGSIWGKPMWGAWWVWDARLTSEFILLLLYAVILALHAAYQTKEQGIRLLSIFILVGLIDLPVIHYSVTWWNTLHQGATFTFFEKPHIDATMLPPLLWMLLGTLLFVVGMILWRTRDVVIWKERKQQWVRDLYVKEQIQC